MSVRYAITLPVMPVGRMLKPYLFDHLVSSTEKMLDYMALVAYRYMVHDSEWYEEIRSDVEVIFGNERYDQMIDSGLYTPAAAGVTITHAIENTLTNIKQGAKIIYHSTPFNQIPRDVESVITTVGAKQLIIGIR